MGRMNPAPLQATTPVAEQWRQEDRLRTERSKALLARAREWVGNHPEFCDADGQGCHKAEAAALMVYRRFPGLGGKEFVVFVRRLRERLLRDAGFTEEEVAVIVDQGRWPS